MTIPLLWSREEVTNVDLDHATIYAAWERYVAGPEPVPDAIEGVRPEIVASWRRSKGKADPFATEPPTLSKQAFEIVLDENKLLCQLAFPYLLEFYRSLRETGHSIMLSDKRGFQLLLLSEDQEFLELSQQAQMNNGCDFSEASVGTNGIGTSLAMAGPVMVWGPEHFLKVYHPLVCYAAPIYDMAHNIVGSINITGPVEVYQPYIMGMLAIATNGIENEFKLTQTNTMLKTVLDSYENGTLLLGADKTILYYNAQVPPLLRLKDEELLGRPISSVVQLSSLPAELQSFDRPVDRVECTLLNKLQEPIDVSLSIRPARHDAHDLDSTIVILRTQKAVHHMANRIAGFQASYTFDSIVGDSGVLQMTKALGQIAAETPAPVLIFGESGTGKEMLAQAIHNASDRADGPFVCVNCSAIPKGLLESELFGYEGWAFSGAKEGGYPGKFELADGGTLFLDEIDALSLDIQAALLEVLQTQSITRLGGKLSKPVNVKLLASTSVSLLGAVQKRMFRDDLYYRLNALNITIPPLRERTEDIPSLVKLFAEKYRKGLGRPPLTFDDESMQALLCYNWPGNVRELENTIERTANLAEGPVVHLSDLSSDVVNYYYAERRKQTPPEPPETAAPRGAADGVASSEELLPLEVQTYNQILSTLKRERGNVKATAAVLGIPLSTLYRKLNKYDLNPKLLRQNAQDPMRMK